MATRRPRPRAPRCSRDGAFWWFRSETGAPETDPWERPYAAGVGVSVGAGALAGAIGVATVGCAGELAAASKR